GIYEKIPVHPIVPDVFLSLDVKYADDIWKKKNRCYMIGIFGKPPELVIEIVSNKIGQENTTKRDKYASMGINYYVIFDPGLHIIPSKLCAYKLVDQSYVPKPHKEYIWFEDLNVGLKIHEGIFEEMDAEWLRWCDGNGNMLLTGTESRDIEKQRAESEKQRAEAEKQRAESEKQKAEAEKQRAEVEKQKAEAEKQRAEVEKQKAEAEKQRAEVEKQRADAERQRAEALEQELTKLKAEKLQAEDQAI
ncbi:MAG: Uma2 family endonuclease, partial [Candidatus Magnetomorum sp.]|nr:Uma2 family endonuclease [Candidatus Magnetomorum sp.]